MSAPVPSRSCLLCGAHTFRRLHGDADGCVLRCRCGLVFVDPLPDPADFARREAEAFDEGLCSEVAGMFASYGRDFRDDPVVRGFRSTVARLRELTGGGRLLDVGIGSGLLLHLAREAGFAPLGIELARSAAESARREFGVEVVEGEFEAVEVAGPIDAITLADVIEHTRDPAAFVARAAAMLRPGGALFVAVPNHASVLFWAADVLARVPVLRALARRLYVPNHYWYFDDRTLRRLVESAGLEVREVRQDDPHLARYQLPLPVRLGLTVLLALGRLLGKRARVQVFAVKPASGRPAAAPGPAGHDPRAVPAPRPA